MLRDLLLECSGRWSSLCVFWLSIYTDLCRCELSLLPAPLYACSRIMSAASRMMQCVTCWERTRPRIMWMRKHFCVAISAVCWVRLTYLSWQLSTGEPGTRSGHRNSGLSFPISSVKLSDISNERYLSFVPNKNINISQHTAREQREIPYAYTHAYSSRIYISLCEFPMSVSFVTVGIAWGFIYQSGLTEDKIPFRPTKWPYWG